MCHCIFTSYKECPASHSTSKATSVHDQPYYCANQTSSDHVQEGVCPRCQSKRSFPSSSAFTTGSDGYTNSQHVPTCITSTSITAPYLPAIHTDVPTVLMPVHTYSSISPAARYENHLPPAYGAVSYDHGSIPSRQQQVSTRTADRGTQSTNTRLDDGLNQLPYQAQMSSHQSQQTTITTTSSASHFNSYFRYVALNSNSSTYTNTVRTTPTRIPTPHPFHRHDSVVDIKDEDCDGNDTNTTNSNTNIKSNNDREFSLPLRSYRRRRSSEPQRYRDVMEQGRAEAAGYAVSGLEDDRDDYEDDDDDSRTIHSGGDDRDYRSRRFWL